ncbi:DAPK1 kinase, partial [Atractosteus spatula]|nr:DAPK1 kinase [Atractosteus spatula]
MSEEEFLRVVKSHPLQTIQDYLTQQGVNINYCDEFSNTALHYAAHNRSREVARLLVCSGGNILHENMHGLTPIHFAAFGGNIEVLTELLLKVPEAVNLQSHKNLSTPLHEAVSGKIVQAVECLLSKGADCNSQNQNGDTPLHLAVSQNSEHICCLLLRHGANVLLRNKRGDTCLHSAAARGALSICQMLVRNGASMQAKNKNSETALFSAVRGTGNKNGDDYCELLSWMVEELGPFLLHRNKDGLRVLDVARQSNLPSKSEVLLQQRTQELQMRDLLKESKAIDRRVAKLCICGHSGVGKTTLAKTLQQQQDGFLSKFQYWFSRPDPPSSTQGVAITEGNLSAGKVVIWDFAGQMEYYFTHSLLLSTESGNVLYCIVFSLENIQCDKGGTQSEALRQVLYWLRFLNVCRNSGVAHKAKVFLVGSHKDTLEIEYKDEVVNHFFDIVQSCVRELGTNLDIDTTVLSVNCKSPSDLQTLRKRLEECVAQLQQNTTDTKFPEICCEVLDEIHTIRRNGSVKYLLWGDFFASINKNRFEKIKVETLRTAVEYLHNVSELLFFPTVTVDGATQSAESGTGNGLVILDVQWLCQDIFGKFGHFALSTLPLQREKWTTENIASLLNLEDSPSTVLRLLEILELVFSEKEGQYIVPAWLNKGRPVNIWEREEVFNVYHGVSFRWQSELGLFSQAFFCRLQLRLMKLFTQTTEDGASAEKFIIWTDGIKCIDTAEALVQVSAGRGSINIAVRGYKPQRSGSRYPDTRQKCYELQNLISCQVQHLLQEFKVGSECEMLFLSSKDLLDKMDASDVDITAYTKDEILLSARGGRNLYSKLKRREEYLHDVLLAGYDQTILQSLKWEATIQWMMAECTEKLCALLDPVHPLGNYWKRLMEALEDCTYENVEALATQSEQAWLSPTLLLFQKHRHTTIYSLYKAFEKLEREDCMSHVEIMLNNIR